MYQSASLMALIEVCLQDRKNWYRFHKIELKFFLKALFVSTAMLNLFFVRYFFTVGLWIFIALICAAQTSLPYKDTKKVFFEKANQNPCSKFVKVHKCFERNFSRIAQIWHKKIPGSFYQYFKHVRRLFKLWCWHTKLWTSDERWDFFQI